MSNFEDLLPSPWDWVPSRELVLTRAYGLRVVLSPASASIRMTATNWELKKVLRTLCPPGHQPLLLESAVTRQQAEVKLVFAEAEAAQVMQNALHRQLVTVSKSKYFAECALDASRGDSAAEQDGKWQSAFATVDAPPAPAGSNLVAVVRKLWAAKGNGSGGGSGGGGSGSGGESQGLTTRGPGERPDTLLVRGLPAKWFEVDTALVGSTADEEEDDDEDGGDEDNLLFNDIGSSGGVGAEDNASGSGAPVVDNFSSAKARAARNSLRKEQRAANVKTLQWAFSRFGTVANLDVQPAKSPEKSGGNGGGSLLSGALGLGGLNIDAYVQFAEPEGFAVALAALRGTVLSWGGGLGAGGASSSSSSFSSSTGGSSSNGGFQPVVAASTGPNLGALNAAAAARTAAAAQAAAAATSSSGGGPMIGAGVRVQVEVDTSGYFSPREVGARAVAALERRREAAKKRAQRKRDRQAALAAAAAAAEELASLKAGLRQGDVSNAVEVSPGVGRGDALASLLANADRTVAAATFAAQSTTSSSSSSNSSSSGSIAGSGGGGEDEDGEGGGALALATAAQKAVADARLHLERERARDRAQQQRQQEQERRQQRLVGYRRAFTECAEMKESAEKRWRDAETAHSDALGGPSNSRDSSGDVALEDISANSTSASNESKSSRFGSRFDNEHNRSSNNSSSSSGNRSKLKASGVAKAAKTAEEAAALVPGGGADAEASRGSHARAAVQKLCLPSCAAWLEAAKECVDLASNVMNQIGNQLNSLEEAARDPDRSSSGFAADAVVSSHPMVVASQEAAQDAERDDALSHLRDTLVKLDAWQHLVHRHTKAAISLAQARALNDARMSSTTTASTNGAATSTSTTGDGNGATEELALGPAAALARAESAMVAAQCAVPGQAKKGDGTNSSYQHDDSSGVASAEVDHGNDNDANLLPLDPTKLSQASDAAKRAEIAASLATRWLEADTLWRSSSFSLKALQEATPPPPLPPLDLPKEDKTSLHGSEMLAREQQQEKQQKQEQQRQEQKQRMQQQAEATARACVKASMALKRAAPPPPPSEEDRAKATAAAAAAVASATMASSEASAGAAATVDDAGGSYTVEDGKKSIITSADVSLTSGGGSGDDSSAWISACAAWEVLVLAANDAVAVAQAAYDAEHAAAREAQAAQAAALEAAQKAKEEAERAAREAAAEALAKAKAMKLKIAALEAQKAKVARVQAVEENRQKLVAWRAYHPLPPEDLVQWQLAAAACAGRGDRGKDAPMEHPFANSDLVHAALRSTHTVGNGWEGYSSGGRGGRGREGASGRHDRSRGGDGVDRAERFRCEYPDPRQRWKMRVPSLDDDGNDIDGDLASSTPASLAPHSEIVVELKGSNEGTAAAPAAAPDADGSSGTSSRSNGIAADGSNTSAAPAVENSSTASLSKRRQLFHPAACHPCTRLSSTVIAAAAAVVPPGVESSSSANHGSAPSSSSRAPAGASAAGRSAAPLMAQKALLRAAGERGGGSGGARDERNNRNNGNVSEPSNVFFTKRQRLGEALPASALASGGEDVGSTPDAVETYPRKCAACKLLLQSANAWAQHISGKKHKLNVKSAEEMPAESNDCNDDEVSAGEDEEDGYDDGDDILFCALCQVQSSSTAERQQHLAGRRHRDAVSVAAEGMVGTKGNGGRRASKGNGRRHSFKGKRARHSLGGN